MQCSCKLLQKKKSGAYCRVVLKIWKNHPGGEQRISGRGEVTAVVSQQATRGRRGDEQGPQGVVVTNGVRTALALVRWRLPLALIQAVRCCTARRGRRAQHAAQRKGTRFARPVPRSHEARPARSGLWNGKAGAGAEANVLELQLQLCTNVLGCV